MMHKKKNPLSETSMPADKSAKSSVASIKGFNDDLQCRGFQFEVGKTYTVSGRIVACGNGFHACPIDQHPLSVFEFYPPAGNRFFEVAQSGATHAQDTKLASASITIGVEISLGDPATRAVKWVFDRANWKDGPVAIGDNEGATASGYSGAATASGRSGRARGALGCALFLVHRDSGWRITKVWAGIVGQNGIKPNTWYSLGDDGAPAEFEEGSD